eukprot:CAMPEP_0118942740 /NCGR_PEP_ID=MMETSP1169-20130426/36753_1 /TAXON_ID=36882 /ORGANISM="Pyramimonas obovata, Strain CCMP722" /LENGTH=198 /DNA_ID=CAMNT_0006887805 /DNA_START=201 /DNA_END=794 /DNA_ORIENTATION=+
MSSLNIRSYTMRANLSCVPPMRDFGFRRKESVQHKIGFRPPLISVCRRAKSKGDSSSGSGGKKKRAKREIIDPELVSSNDPKKFNSGWLNPERNQTLVRRQIGEGKGKNKRGRPRKSTKEKANNHGGIPTQAELKQRLGKEEYDILIGKYVTSYCMYTRELQWWREGFVARQGREPDWDDMPAHHKKKELWLVHMGPW